MDAAASSSSSGPQLASGYDSTRGSSQSGTSSVGSGGSVGAGAHSMSAALLEAQEDQEKRFFKDGKCVDEGGHVMMTFDLADGQQWKKRVWPRREHPVKLRRWNTVEEILSYLISFDRHQDWVSTEVPQRSPSGTILFFDRSKTKKYRGDGYDWKTRRTMNKTVREDRMKLKVGGYQLVYGCYAHSASDPNFHRRTYWLIKNPNLIMVHYLDSHEFFGSTNGQNPVSLDPHMLPTHWSMLTISDNNLCTLLDSTKAAEDTKSLLARLPIVLSYNLGHCSTLEEALTSNNTGLPADISTEYSRSKKPKLASAKSAGKDVLQDIQASHPVQINTSCSSAPSPASAQQHGVAVGASVAQSSGQVKVFKKVLSKSPHIIMCCPNNGSVSYILTVPTSEGTQTRSSLPLLAKAPLPEGQGGNLGVLLRGNSGPLEGVDRQGLGKVTKNRKISAKGKDKASDEKADIMEYIQQAISKLIKPSSLVDAPLNPASSDDLDTPTPLTPATPTLTPATPCYSATPSVASSHDFEAGSHDYDPEKFSKFADFLVKMDPIDSLSSLLDEDPVTSRNSRTDSFRSSESDPMESSIGSVGQNSSGGLGQNDSNTGHTTSGLGHTSTEGLGHTATTASLGHTSMEGLGHTATTASLGHTSMEGLGHTATTASLGHTSMEANTTSLGHSDLGHKTTTTSSGHSSMEGVATDPQIGCQEMRVLESNVADLVLPDVPMDWLFPETGGKDVGSGFDTQSSHDSDDWQQYLRSPEDIPNNEHHSSLDISQLVDNLTSSDLEGVHPYDARAAASLNADTAKPAIGVPQVAVTTTASSNSWNGMWQDCNPNSTNSWLQSSLSLDNTGVPRNGSLSLTDSNLHPPHSHPQSCSPNDTDLPQELHDFIFETTSNTPCPTSISASGPSHSPTPHHSTALHDRTHLSNFNHQTPSTANNPLTSGHLSSNPLPTSPHVVCLPVDPLPNIPVDPLPINPSMAHGSTNMPCDPTFLQPRPGTSRLDTTRKISDSSVYSEPLYDMEPLDQSLLGQSYISSHHQLHLSLPDLTSTETAFPPQLSTAEFAFPSITVADADGYYMDSTDSISHPSTGGGVVPSGPPSQGSHDSIGSSHLQSLHQEAQMLLWDGLEEPPLGYLGYRTGTNTSIPSSPSAGSVSSSTMSMQDRYEDSPSVKELCEMLSESVNMQQADRTLTDSEQDQLFHAAETIQVAFRKYKSRGQLRSREKRAALLIEKYYKKYREAKEERDQAARRIQNQYRLYKNRTRELNELSRAATFIQQMYRFQRIHRPSTHPYHRPNE